MEQKIGYKVITKETRMSSIILSGDNIVYYPKGIEVKPNTGCGPLCVFHSISIALNFSSSFKWSFVVKCKYIPSEQNKVWKVYTFIYAESYTKTYLSDLSDLPRGTILADSVTCLE